MNDRICRNLLAGAMLLALAYAANAGAVGLVDAAQSGDTGAALAEIDAGADVNEPAADGTTALHWAVYNDDAALVERLIAAGADVDAANDYGATPLSQAAVVGNADVVRMLLEAGADVEARDPDGQTALMVVARSSNVDAARALLEHGADANAREEWRRQTALMWAAAQKQPAMVRLLLEHGAEPNVRSAANEWSRQVSAERRRMYRPFGGLTPLIYAAREGCLECAQALVEGGADPDMTDPRGVTPLIVAIDNLHFDVAAYLIDAGADIQKWDWWGRTPLYMAVDMNTLPHGGRPDLPSTSETTSLELVERLLQAGANPNAQLKLTPPYRHVGDDRGCDAMLTTGATPLLRAAKTFDVDAMRLLIEHDALLRLPNENGVTPLMAAAGYGSVECDIRGYGPGIPHYHAHDVEEKSIEALRVLIEAGADIDARTTGGRGGRGPGQTALFGAAFWGWNDVSRFLVDSGAKIDVADTEGRTPVDAALGRAGGHGRGSSVEVFEDTAELLRELCSMQPDCDLSSPEPPPAT
ncbi:MAG: ankyrin repeat domain-containing protein [Gammaproteobacteria bacterium]|nr:ankyrin repeat domain-containing protein [Gammaproteobacteria bacterium]